MTFTEAITVARTIIDELPHVTVIGIGRFLQVEEIRPDSPWRISVMAEGQDRIRMINEPDDLKFYRKPVPVQAARSAHRESTPMLF